MSAGEIRVVVGRVSQNEHRLLPLHLGQFVDYVEELLQVRFECVEGDLPSPGPHFV